MCEAAALGRTRGGSRRDVSSTGRDSGHAHVEQRLGHVSDIHDDQLELAPTSSPRRPKPTQAEPPDYAPGARTSTTTPSRSRTETRPPVTWTSR